MNTVREAYGAHIKCWATFQYPSNTEEIQHPERLSAFNTMAQPNSHPGLMSHLANAMIPAVATMASGVANPGQPTETATGSTVITKATIAPLQSLTWEQLLTLVKAAHNPRFCGSLSVAQSIRTARFPVR